MRMCEPEYSLDNVWHVLDVLEGSPAEDAGLVPYGDWIIGWSGGVLSAENDFYEVVESHIDKPLRVYVYSHDFDTIREVVLVPNRQWGGEGLLGCVFGFGLLHRIPAQPADREPGSIPPELREDDEDFEEQTLFVPAEVPVPQPGTPDEHHFTFPQNPGHDWEDVHDGEGHDHHAHDHDHDHGHDHDHAHHSHSPPYEHAHPESVSPAPAQTPPVRPASHTHSVSPGPERSSTPTPGSRPFGSLVNGIGSMNINAGRFGPPPPNLERSLSSGSAMSSSSTFGLVKDPAAAVDEKESESYDDSATSVVGTETSDDETASQGSLTSVD
ncbi:hypothetical protein OE88DRAFT_1657310 [Heliocybe sulcata]|uniref:PDZ GRASP-type domain-containing protein n=1 Tax=Heliocybe sulcata TaxID=5364 RepID=A0A5C3N383_9AGAM|nr:hypothetical protein OE88DRAFT_1657310 [Heliocybe sulcata]